MRYAGRASLPNDPKINNHDLTRRPDQQVRGLDVTMHELAVMDPQRQQRIGDSQR
jgi:hypothetical protein